MRSLALVVRIFLVATSALPQELPLSKAQQEVWNREEAYGAAIRSRNADAYLSLSCMKISWAGHTSIITQSENQTCAKTLFHSIATLKMSWRLTTLSAKRSRCSEKLRLCTIL
jgi:hypothetical protein